MFALAKPSFLNGLISLFYPPLCAFCNNAVESGEHVCATCATTLPRIRPPFCDKCSEPFAGAITDAFSCANCAHRKLHFDSAVAVYRSRGAVRELIHDFKYGRQRQLRHPIAGWLAESLDDLRLRGRRFDLFVPVPLHPARERERGFNQATLLAELMSQRTGIPLEPALQRIRYTTTQTQFDRLERMENLKGTFRLRRGFVVQDLHVLLIDDVLTTGSTLSECAWVLKQAGAVSVYAATAARG